MKRTLISLAAVAALAAPAVAGRARTHDVAFTFRMGAGFPGDINRTHPFSVEPGLMNTTSPALAYGAPMLLDTATNSYRRFLVGDTAVTKLDGILVRPYPTQQQSGGMSSAMGAATPPVTGVIDVLNDGYIMVQCANFAASPPSKGTGVFIRTAVTAGLLIQGGLHAADDGANAIQVTNARWNGPADANGVAELVVWKG